MEIYIDIYAHMETDLQQKMQVLLSNVLNSFAKL